MTVCPRAAPTATAPRASATCDGLPADGRVTRPRCRGLAAADAGWELETESAHEGSPTCGTCRSGAEGDEGAERGRSAFSARRHPSAPGSSAAAAGADRPREHVRFPATRSERGRPYRLRRHPGAQRRPVALGFCSQHEKPGPVPRPPAWAWRPGRRCQPREGPAETDGSGPPVGPPRSRGPQSGPC